ncbi:MAG: 50S ribosomal protein L29 [Clostridia bacterium]|nr:50S ribosomal protein L29 [Clostridia bacterium]MBR2053049.1 50S ribosomal protein L29 [Clostridia bacterium]MBR2220867.1 50S ribosomal protein L29 [Clostridia bacterium]MBR2433490.1 50S ribosomal protein L29 [Clostridia bacterium]MBR3790311.1 50S ribosomal protein L29 [Clostridia bacterium]
MKKADIKSLTNAELTSKLSELKSELFNLRFSLATGNLPNNSQIKNVKKEIARIKTILRERELKAEVAGN